MAEKDQERGDRIRNLRELKGYTQDELAEEMGATDGSHVSKWENGAGISRKHLVKLASVLEASEKYILEGVGDYEHDEQPPTTIEEKIDRYKSRKEQKDFSGTERDLLLQFLLGHAESLSEGLRRLIEIEGKGHPDD